MKQNTNNQYRRSSDRVLSTLILSAGLMGAFISFANAQDDRASDLLEMSMSGKDSGVSAYTTFIGEVYTNHRGGIKNGSAFAGLIDIGVEVDLGKTWKWEGASIVTSAFYFAGGDVTGQRIGDFNAATNLYTDTSFNFYNIFFQQSFGQGDSFFKIGQIALDDDFMVSESALLFINAGFGPLPIQSGNTAAPIYALAAPGGVVNLDIKDSGFLRIGAYVGDAGRAEAGNQGFDWNTGSNAGWMVMAEAGYYYGEDDASVLKLGGYYHTGIYDKFSDGDKERGIYGIYAIVDHEMIAMDEGLIVNTFFRAGIAPEEDIAVVTDYVEAGFVGRNIFKQEDALGFSASWTNLSDDFRKAEGGRSSETVLELSYKLPMNDWLTIQPDIEYIVNPQGGGENALVTGLRVEIAF